VNLCMVCKEDFGSVQAFDTHRIGAYPPGDYTGPIEEWEYEKGRRCMTVEEMQEGDKFVKNQRGRWSLKDSLERARALRA
jgi:hypothetical protein